MLIADRLGAGGSFTALQGLNFREGVAEMGHGGQSDLAISTCRPLLRGLGVYRGKKGRGVSAEFDVPHGPVTPVGLGQSRGGRYRPTASEGEDVGGPLLEIGVTPSRVGFGCDPGEWTDAGSADGVAHHRAFATGRLLPELRCLTDLAGLERMEVAV